MENITLIGLGYVGLPLAVAFAQQHHVCGFDLKQQRIDDLKQGDDKTLEVDKAVLQAVLRDNNEFSTGFFCTNNVDDIADSSFYIVTVPTPIDKNKHPDLRPLYSASETVGKVLKKGDIVIYESTVYPGVTEEECVPILEKVSGLKYNVDFFAGYSPERINPGDKEHTVTKIKKITSGSTPEVADKVDALYRSIITAGTHKAPSIKVAEAAKVIENSQRDINIAFVNELAHIFNRLGIDTNDVLEAAASKWNFLKFRPGLVGGHCIGVDPYYLAQKAQQIGYHPEVILTGRRINDGMGDYVAQEMVKLLIKKDIRIKNAKVLVLGITFKENCPDVRNTKVVDILNAFKSYDIHTVVYDPWADPTQVQREYGWKSSQTLSNDQDFDAVLLAVAHSDFEHLDLTTFCKPKHVIFDVKGVLDRNLVDARL